MNHVVTYHSKINMTYEYIAKHTCRISCLKDLSEFISDSKTMAEVISVEIYYIEIENFDFLHNCPLLKFLHLENLLSYPYNLNLPNTLISLTLRKLLQFSFKSLLPCTSLQTLNLEVLHNVHFIDELPGSLTELNIYKTVIYDLKFLQKCPLLKTISLCHLPTLHSLDILPSNIVEITIFDVPIQDITCILQCSLLKDLHIGGLIRLYRYYTDNYPLKDISIVLRDLLPGVNIYYIE